MKYTLFFCTILLFFSCKDTIQNPEDDLTASGLIAVDMAAVDTGTSFQQLFNFERIVALDSTETIGTVSKMYADEKGFVIGDLKNTHKLFLYGPDGRLEGAINPVFFTQYKQITDFDLSPDGREIILFDGYNIYRFDRHGKFLKTLETASFGGNVATPDGEHHLVYASFFDTHDNAPYKIKWFDANGRPEGMNWKQTQFLEFDNGGILNICRSANEASILMSQALNDTIYALDRQKIKRAYRVDFGARTVKKPELFRNKPLPELYAAVKRENLSTGIDMLLDTKQFLHFSYLKGDHFVSCYYNKQQGKTSVINPAQRRSLWAMFPPAPIAATPDGAFVFVLEPQEILGALRHGRINQAELESAFPALARTLESVSAFSNPLLVIGRINQD